MDIVMCNKCGKIINKKQTFDFTYTYGYNSKRDMDVLKLNLCDECLDELTDKLIAECQVKPVIEWTGDPDKPYLIPIE
jgi:NAD-dependent SIR2 family protein deacetylase